MFCLKSNSEINLNENGDKTNKHLFFDNAQKQSPN